MEYSNYLYMVITYPYYIILYIKIYLILYKIYLIKTITLLVENAEKNIRHYSGILPADGHIYFKFCS